MEPLDGRRGFGFFGRLTGFPLPTGAFDSKDDWSRRYRIRTCYGYRSRSSREQGRLTIRPVGRPDAEHFDLAVEQVVTMDPKKGGQDHLLQGHVRWSGL